MSDEINAPTKDQIEKRAYELCLARGCAPGKELDDWLGAEAALRLEMVTRDSPVSDLKPPVDVPTAPRKRARKRAGGLA